MDDFFFKSRSGTKPRLPLKSGLFPLVYWFVNLTLTEEHDTKNS